MGSYETATGHLVHESNSSSNHFNQKHFKVRKLKRVSITSFCSLDKGFNSTFYHRIYNYYAKVLSKIVTQDNTKGLKKCKYLILINTVILLLYKNKFTD